MSRRKIEWLHRSGLKAKQHSIINIVMQVAGTTSTRKMPNEIRFDGWERND